MSVVCPKNYGNCGISISYDPSKLFVLMPFREEQAPQSLFTDALEQLQGWNVLRADRDFSKPEIWCKICANIQESRAVIADLSGPNANVFLELGLAWGFGRPFILLTQDYRTLPFDTRAYHVTKYERNPNNPSEVLEIESLQNEIIRALGVIPEIPTATRLPLQTPEGHLNQSIASARSIVVRRFWKKIDGTWKIVLDASSCDRIALALLRTHPHSREQKELVIETQLGQSIVSETLRGKKGDCARYFREDGHKWLLNDTGIYWVLEDLVPRLVSLG